MLAVGSLGALRANETVPPLIERLQSDDAPEVRRSAAVALGTLGTQAAPAGEALRRALQHPDARVRQNSGVGLGPRWRCGGGTSTPRSDRPAQGR